MSIAHTPEISDAVQDYAKAIYSLHERSDEPASTSAIAERLGVSAASASAMVKRLESLGLVRREPYHGVELTPAGERVALEVIRHHRLLELYLAEALGMPWDRVHEEAEVLEHAISPELSALIAAKLGNPTHDPHGDPIPTVDGEIEERRTRALADLHDRASTAPSRGCPTPTPRCCATSPRAGSSAAPRSSSSAGSRSAVRSRSGPAAASTRWATSWPRPCA